MKDVDLEEPTSFLDHVYFGFVLKQECTESNNIVTKLQRYFEARISVKPRRTTYKSFRENLMQKQYPLGPATWKVIQRNVWKIFRTCE